MHAVSSVLLVAHHERAEAGRLARTTAQWLIEQGHDAWLCEVDADAHGIVELGRPAATALASTDLVVSLGGDGTMLRAVQLLAGLPVPVLGVNVGLLGYLTELEPDALLAALERWSAGPEAGRWQLEQRMLLGVSAARSSGEQVGRWTALNEAVVEKLEPGHTVRLQVFIDGASFTSYAADGLILATPTGSTAYSLSARGPVLSPRMRAVLLTPVSPHMLFDRSLVLDPSEEVVVELLGHRRATLSIDGQPAVTLDEGDRVTVTPADQVALLVRLGERRFHQILKAKFGLTDR
jgi:NAD+ kinase